MQCYQLSCNNSTLGTRNKRKWISTIGTSSVSYALKKDSIKRDKHRSEQRLNVRKQYTCSRQLVNGGVTDERVCSCTDSSAVRQDTEWWGATSPAYGPIVMPPRGRRCNHPPLWRITPRRIHCSPIHTYIYTYRGYEQTALETWLVQISSKNYLTQKWEILICHWNWVYLERVSRCFPEYKLRDINWISMPAGFSFTCV